MKARSDMRSRARFFRIGLGVVAAAASISLAVSAPPRSLAARLAAAAPQQFELVGSDTKPGDFFGYFTALNGDTLLLGAPYHADGGRAYVFTRPGTSGSRPPFSRGMTRLRVMSLVWTGRSTPAGTS